MAKWTFNLENGRTRTTGARRDRHWDQSGSTQAINWQHFGQVSGRVIYARVYPELEQLRRMRSDLQVSNGQWAMGNGRTVDIRHGKNVNRFNLSSAPKTCDDIRVRVQVWIRRQGNASVTFPALTLRNSCSCSCSCSVFCFSVCLRWTCVHQLWTAARAAGRNSRLSSSGILNMPPPPQRRKFCPFQRYWNAFTEQLCFFFLLLYLYFSFWGYISIYHITLSTCS